MEAGGLLKGELVGMSCVIDVCARGYIHTHKPACNVAKEDKRHILLIVVVLSTRECSTY